MSIVNGYRNRGLSTPIDDGVLLRAGVSESLVPRTLRALQQLELIDEGGKPTPRLEGLRTATSEEFQATLAEAVRAAYADVFAFTDPARDDETRVTDAFRVYKPVSMRPRMISLFMGLCEEAGIIPPKAKTGRSGTKVSGGATKRAAPPAATRPATARHNVRTSDGGLVPEGILGFIRDIQWGGVTQEKREQIAKTFPVLLDLYLPTVPEDGTEQ